MELERTYKLEDIDLVAQEIITMGSYSLYCINGKLGSGKTTLAKSLLKLLGVSDHIINSPTFSLMHEYRSADMRSKIYHMDLYRIVQLDPILKQELQEIISSSIVVVEWPKFDYFFSKFNPLWIDMKDVSPVERKITAHTMLAYNLLS